MAFSSAYLWRKAFRKLLTIYFTFLKILCSSWTHCSWVSFVVVSRETKPRLHTSTNCLKWSKFNLSHEYGLWVWTNHWEVLYIVFFLIFCVARKSAEFKKTNERNWFFSGHVFMSNFPKFPGNLRSGPVVPSLLSRLMSSYVGARYNYFSFRPSRGKGLPTNRK